MSPILFTLASMACGSFITWAAIDCHRSAKES